MTKSSLQVLPSLQNKHTRNDVQSQRANFSSYISPLRPKDKLLIKETVLKFRPHSINYEDSWGYIIQACRYNGFKWYDPETGYLIFWGQKSEKDPTLVIPNFFAKPDYLASAIKAVQIYKNSPKVILKNISHSDAKALIHSGFRYYRRDEVWSGMAKYDDQTYPQLILDLNKLSAAQGRSYRNLRTALNKNVNVRFRKYNKADLEKVLEIFALRDGNTPNSPSKEHGMYYASHAVYPGANIGKYVVEEIKTGKILGFLASSDISNEYTALVASIFIPGVKVASIWGMYQALMEKRKEGFHQINIGGFETEGTYNFLRRTFRPVAQLKRLHLIYEPTD